MTLYLPVVPSRIDGFECIPFNKKNDVSDVFAQQSTSENKFKFYYDLSPLNQDSDYTHVGIKFLSVDSNFNPIVNKYSNGIYIAAKQSDSNGNFIEVPAHIFIQPSNTVAVGNINMDSTDNIPKIVTGTSPTTYRNILYSDYDTVADSGVNDYYRSQIKLINLTATNSFSYTSSKWVTVVKANTSVTTASAIITVSDTNGLIVGLNASGGGLLDGVVISSISGSSITLSANSNQTTTSNISFYLGQTFLNNTLGSYVSDWSYQTIMKPVFISNLLGFDSQDKEYIGITDFKSRTTTSGTLYTTSNTASAEFYPFQFQYQVNEPEQLVEYEFILYDNTKTKIDGSGLIETQKYLSQTSVTWTNSVALTDNATYYLAIYFKTDSGFSYTKRYQFIADYTSTSFVLNFTSTNDRDNGRIEFALSGATSSNNSLLLLRSSFDDGYDNFKTIAVFDTADLTSSTQKYFYDYLIEPGMLYRYKFQSAVTNSLGDIISRGASTTTSIQPHIIPDFTGSFLYGKDDIQMNFIYNGQISGFREVKKDAIIETIGAKYPYVIRNSNIGYKQFQFSAIITHVSDPLRRLQGLTYTELVSNLERDADNNYILPTAATNREMNERYEDFLLTGPNIFTSSTSSYVSSTDYGKNNISSSSYLTRTENFLVEKQFRKKLISWLSDGNPKVFKSDTEGLFLVKLTDISFEPVVELGRTLYNFSCTITEIDELNYANLIKYGLRKPKYEIEDLYLISNINNFTTLWSAGAYLPENQYFYVQDGVNQYRFYRVASTGTTGTTAPTISEINVNTVYTSVDGTYTYRFVGYQIPGKF